jgi:hypothetical protein
MLFLNKHQTISEIKKQVQFFKIPQEEKIMVKEVN